MISHARNRAQAEEIGPLRAQLAALQAPALEAGAPPRPWWAFWRRYGR
jgi:hypothetical protein